MVEAFVLFVWTKPSLSDGAKKLLFLSEAMVQPRARTALLALFVLGGLDQISVVVRQSLVLIHTPDELRGRMNAINSIFIGTSNQMGEFESGFLASLIGPVATVVFGGIGTVVVVLIIAATVPELRNLGSLSERISKRSDKRPAVQ